MDIVEQLREYESPLSSVDRAKTAYEIERLRSVLQECHDFVDKYADVVDGDDGQPEPNEAMSLLGLINDALDGES